MVLKVSMSALKLQVPWDDPLGGPRPTPRAFPGDADDELWVGPPLQSETLGIAKSAWLEAIDQRLVLIVIIKS